MTRPIIFIFLLCVIFPATLTAQKDTANQRWSIGAEFNRDYLFYVWSKVYIGPTSPIYFKYRYYSHSIKGDNDQPNYSFGVRFNYKALKWLSLDFKLLYSQFRNNITEGATYNHDSIPPHKGVDFHQIEGFEVPSGLSFCFFNKKPYNPYIAIGVISFFSFHEKAALRTGPLYIEQARIRPYSIRLRIGIGYDIHIRKKWAIGNDFFFTSQPMWQTTRSLIVGSKYSTISFSIHLARKI